MEPAKQAVDSVAEGVKKVAIGGKKDKKKGGADTQRAVEMSPPPDFLQHRLDMYGPCPIPVCVSVCCSLVVLTIPVSQLRPAQEEVR